MNYKNKIFIKILLIILLAAIVPISELLLPIDRFTFRSWEATRVYPLTDYLPGFFYPNQRIERKEVGDLGSHTEQQITKDIIWETDELGYRNTRNCNPPNAILIGDSMGSGTSITQDRTLNELIKKTTGLCSYSFAPARLEPSLKTVVRLQWQPRYAFVVYMERTLFELEDFPMIENPPKLPRKKFFFQEAGLSAPIVLWDRLLRSAFFRYRKSHGTWKAIQRLLEPYEYQSGPIEKRKMLFLHGESILRDRANDQRVIEVVDQLTSYRDKLRDMGMEMILVVAPNKESVYPELIPSTIRSDFFPRFYKVLDQKGIHYVNLWQPYRAAYEKEKKIFFHLDDSHWNEDGVKVASDLLAQKWREIKNDR